MIMKIMRCFSPFTLCVMGFERAKDCYSTVMKNMTLTFWGLICRRSTSMQGL